MLNEPDTLHNLHSARTAGNVV